MTNTEPTPNSSENNTSIPPIDELPDGLGKSLEQLSSDKLNYERLVSESKQIRDKTTKEDGPETSSNRVLGFIFHLFRHWPTIAIWTISLVIILAFIDYILEGKPFFPINATLSSTTQVISDTTQSAVLPQPAYVILGQYQNKLYTYNSGVGKVYAYITDPNNPQEDDFVRVPEFKRFLWHNQGKLLLISTAENSLGNIYIFDLTQPNSDSELPTKREDAPDFPSNLRVDDESQLAWSQDGEVIAFTARDVKTDQESLFIYELGSLQLTYTPAQKMDRITSLLWITNTATNTVDILSFVAINNGQEKRYFVDRAGAGFTEWVIKR